MAPFVPYNYSQNVSFLQTKQGQILSKRPMQTRPIAWFMTMCHGTHGEVTDKSGYSRRGVRALPHRDCISVTN